MTRRQTAADGGQETVTIAIGVTAQVQATAKALAAVPFSDPITDGTYAQAAAWYADGKRRIAEIENWFEAVRRPLNEARAKVIQTEKATLDGPRRMLRTVGAWLQAYRRDVELRRREAEERAQAEERRKAEAKRQAQLDGLKAAAKATTSRTEKAILRGQAAALAATPVIAAAPVAVDVPSVDGVGLREHTTYAAEVYDLASLVRAVGAGLFQAHLRSIGRDVPDWLLEWPVAPLQYVQANLVELNVLATQARSEMPVPGVRSVRKTTLVAR